MSVLRVPFGLPNAARRPPATKGAFRVRVTRMLVALGIGSMSFVESRLGVGKTSGTLG
jgi:hypothetical protein